MNMSAGALCGMGLALAAAGSMVGEAPGPWTLWYREPATKWVEALPIGNGRLGAMVFGGVEEERLQLNEDTLWSGEPKEWNNPDAVNWLPKVREALFAGRYAEAEVLCKKMQGPFTQSYQPLGDLRIVFGARGEVEAYRRELDLDTAVTTTRYRLNGVGFMRKVFASHPAQVIAVRVEADQPGAVSFTARLSSPHPTDTLPFDDGSVLLLGRAPAHVEPNYRGDRENAVVYETDPDGKGMRFAVFLRAVPQGGAVEVDNAGALTVRGADAVVLLLSANTSFAGYDKSPSADGVDPSVEALAHLQSASGQTWNELLTAHVADHRLLFRRVSIDLGKPHNDVPTPDRVRAYERGEADPNLAALLFQYGRYLLVASSRPGSQPANLQGIWNREIRPPWSSNYTTNINSEMNYWPAEVCNLSECHEPMLRLIEEWAENGRDTARVNYGCDGWVGHHNTDLWRQSAPVGDFGHGSPHWANFAMGGVWHCMDLWEHYSFTRDEAYLRNVAYPLMKGAARFCLDWLIADGQGHLVTAPSVSTENTQLLPDRTPCGVSIASTQDIALIWDLFTNCIEASRVLGTDAAFRQQLEAARARLLPYQVGARGQLQEWSVDFDEAEPHHRHLSHLIGAFPGRQITPEDTPELAAAVRRSLELRGDESTGWSMAWKVNLWARLKDGDRAHSLLGYLLRLVRDEETNYSCGGIYPNLFAAHPPFQIDANFGVTAGIAEMLLQSHRRTEDGRYVIDLLPALPSAWPEGRVSGLKARGGLTVSMAWTGGELTEARLESATGGAFVLAYRGREEDVHLAPGTAKTICPRETP